MGVVGDEVEERKVGEEREGGEENGLKLYKIGENKNKNLFPTCSGVSEGGSE